jgi:hypothetical protein
MSKRNPSCFWRRGFAVMVPAFTGAWLVVSAQAATLLGPLNPGFEQGGADWFSGGSGGAAGSVNFSNPGENGPSDPGTNCASETSDGSGNTDFRVSAFSLGLAATGTNPVTFSFDYNILSPVSSGNNVRVGLRFFDITGGNYQGESDVHIGSDNSDTGGNGWQTYSMTVTPPSTAYTADIRVSMNVFGDDDWSVGEVLFDNFSVTAAVPPIVGAPTVSPAASVASPTTVTFEITPSGSVPFGYQWQKDTAALVDGTNADGTIITGATSNVLVVANSHTADSGSYDVVVSNAYGTNTSSAQTLTVSAEVYAPSITNVVVSPSSGTNDLHTGINPMSITVDATGTGPLTYQWQKNGAGLPGQTNATLAVANALTNSGAYTVVVANSVSSITSAPPTVLTVVDSAPIAMTLTDGSVIGAVVDTVFADPGYTVTDDYGVAVTVQVTGTVNTNVCGVDALHYTVTDTLGHTFITNRTVNVAVISESFNESQSAHGIVSQAPGWQAYAISESTGELVDYTSQTSPSEPSLAANRGTVGALGNAGFLQLGNVSTVGPSLVWKDTTAALAKWQLTNVTFYTLDSDPSSTVQLVVRVGTNWYVSAQTFSDNTGGVAPWAPQTFAFDTAAASWNLFDITTLQVSGGLTDPLPNYSISAFGFLGVFNSGTILVDELEATGVPATFAVTPPMAALPTVAPLNPNDGTAWSGTPLYFTVSALGSTPVSYQWRVGGVAINGATNNPWILNNPGTANSGNYDVVVSNTIGSITSAVVAVTVSSSERPASVVLGPLNPGFEQGATSWNAGGTGGAAGSISFANPDENGPGDPGTNCVSETSNGTGNTDFRVNAFSLGTAATGTNEVTFSFDYNILSAIGSGNNVRVGLRFFDVAGTSFQGENNSHIGSDNADPGAIGWQHFSVTVTPPATAYTADIRVSMNVFGDDAWTDGTVLFDNFTVRVGSETPPLAANVTLNADSGAESTLRIVGGTQPATDLSGDPLIVSEVGTPSHGGATTDGTNIVYTSTAGYAGIDTFTYTVSDSLGGIATAYVTVSVVSAGSNRLAIPVALGGSEYKLTFSGIASSNYALEWAGSLAAPVTWRPQTTNTTDSSGIVNYTNTQTASAGYWRIRYVP